MRHVVPHQLGVEGGKRVLDEAFAAYAAAHPRHEAALEWLDEHTARLSTLLMGVRVEGLVTVTPSSAELEVQVPFALRVFVPMAIRTIDLEARRWLLADQERRAAAHDC